ncbi:MAG: IS110 family transposase [Cytophagaceae bacterium]|nr:IS110 family transposase [Cytophagaceae bacterium]
MVASIKGVALINTVSVLVATQNFRQFEIIRQFAYYVRMLSFGRQSGTSTNCKTKVSHLANKKIKTLPTQAAQCAQCAIRHDQNIKAIMSEN